MIEPKEANALLKWFVVIVLVAGGLFILDQLGLWLERKGWLYYRNSEGQGSSSTLSGGIVTEFQSFVDPAVKNLEEVDFEHQTIYAGDGEPDEEEGLVEEEGEERE